MKIYRFLFVLSFISVFTLISCEKNTQPKNVTYEISRSISGFSVTYKDASGELIKEKITTASAEDVWRYSFEGIPRDVIYVSASYKDINSAIRVRLLVDGKVYKEAATKYDTTMFVTVSGIIPD